MKRSEINQYLRDAKARFQRHAFYLPPFAAWSPEQYRERAADYPEIRACQLGWDLTDFGRGNYQKDGLLLFTLRNGLLDHPDYCKPYAEKIMLSQVNQKTPLHYHLHKTEDIINRGGGCLVFEFFNCIPGTAKLDHAAPVEVPGDGTVHRLPAGGHLRIGPGESLTLKPGLFHSFWAEKEPVIIGEVSAINDDHSDNIFFEEQRRFPLIEEDEPPLHLLVGDYDRFHAHPTVVEK